MIAASGLFLAATYAFSREPSLLAITKGILVITLVCLVWSILAALSVLRASEFELLDGGKRVGDALSAVKVPMAACGERYLRYLEQQLEGATDILASLEAVNEGQRSKLEAAQWLLAIAAFLAVAGTVVNMTFLPLAR